MHILSTLQEVPQANHLCEAIYVNSLLFVELTLHEIWRILPYFTYIQPILKKKSLFFLPVFFFMGKSFHASYYFHYSLQICITNHLALYFTYMIISLL